MQNIQKLNMRGPRTSNVSVKFIASPFTRRILNSRFMSFLVGRLRFVIGRLQNLFSGIFEIQGNPALTNALTGVGLGVATAGARFLGKN